MTPPALRGETRSAWHIGVVLGALAFAWICTTPRAIALINWDNAAYIAGIASGRYDWSNEPWSSHLGVGQEYLLGVWLARPFGGTVIDGFRLTNALFFAAACLVLFTAIERLTRSRALGLVLTLAWATAWVNLHYHFILEDNILFLAPGAAILSLCVLHVDRWQPRHSLMAGALGWLAFLGSYQALPYLATAFYAALISPGRRPSLRLRDPALVVAAFFATGFLWMALMVVTSRLTWSSLFHSVRQGPVPNFMPHSASDLIAYLLDGHSLLETLGNGVIWQLSFKAYWLESKPWLERKTLGQLAALLQIGLYAFTTWWSWRHRRWAPHLLAAGLLLFSFITSLHRDLVDYTGLKRYDFVPLFFLLLAAYALGELRDRAPRLPAIALALTLPLIVLQTTLGVQWTLRQQARYVTRVPWNAYPHPEIMWHGREGKSWFRYFRDLGRQHRDACQIVLSYGEVGDGSWNFDITGSLWSEVPNHLALVSDQMYVQWNPSRQRYPPHYVKVSAATIPPCAWISEDAARLLRQAGR